MSKELEARLLDLADCEAQAGESLGKCMREAAAQLKRYREALEFYRDEWEVVDALFLDPTLALLDDEGYIARKALDQ